MSELVVCCVLLHVPTVGLGFSQRTVMRFARVATADIEARLGPEIARVVNVSATATKASVVFTPPCVQDATATMVFPATPAL